MRQLGLGLAMAAAGLAMALQTARADEELPIGVIAAQSGSFVSAGNTIVGAANLAAQQINEAGGIKVGDKTYKIKLYIRDNRTDVNVTIAAARELVNDIGVKAIWGTETHDFSVSMAKITGPAKVLQFSGNSSLGAVLDDKAVAEDGWLHYTFQSEPQEWQRSGSTAKGVLSLLTPQLKSPPKHSVVFVGNDATGQYLSSHYVKALEAEGQKVDLVQYPPDTTDFSPLLTRIKGMKPDIVHFWYNGDSTLTAFPQALKLGVAPSYFLFGVDPGIYQERSLKADVPVTLSCVPVCWGSSPYPEVKQYFDKYFGLGAAKGPQSSVSLLYYDYFFWYAKALEKVGKIDDPDAVVAELLKSDYKGVVSPVPLVFNKHHQVTFATEVCMVEPNTSDKFKCAVEQPPAAPPPGDNGG
ncbi:MAG: ABC transporter substrate-binding protein [Mesorhizobium sp.]|nr:MAG: ABC transporter substrate-binding protein [Mesorhizobium sp.]